MTKFQTVRPDEESTSFPLVLPDHRSQCCVSLAMWESAPATLRNLKASAGFLRSRPTEAN